MWVEIKNRVRSLPYGGGTVIPSGTYAQIAPHQEFAWPPRHALAGSQLYVVAFSTAESYTVSIAERVDILQRSASIAENRTEGIQQERDRVRSILISAGLSLPTSDQPQISQLSSEQREDLARRISGGTPLSEIIIEERRGR